MVKKQLFLILLCFFLLVTSVSAQPTLPPHQTQYNGGSATVDFFSNILSPLTGTCTGNTCTVDLASSGVSGSSCTLCNLSYTPEGLITSATPGSISPAFNLHIDVNGVNSTTCGAAISPCRDTTGTNGAFQRIITNNDLGSATCSADTDVGCMRCTGTSASSSAAPAGDKCNANPPWESDCGAGGAAGSMCSDWTCGGDSAKGCAFFCTTATTVPCLYSSDCPNRDTCNSAPNTCTGTNKCWAGANNGAACSVASQCPGGTCSPTCSGGPRNGLGCAGTPIFDFQCSTNTCGGTDYCQSPSLAPNSACSGGICATGPKTYVLNYGAGNFNDVFDRSTQLKTIPIGRNAGITFKGTARGATTLYGTVTSGIHYNTTDTIGTTFSDMRLNCLGSASCLGSTGNGAINLQNTTIRYGSAANPGVSYTGQGNRYNTWENSWIYGPSASYGTALVFENYGPFGCTNDATKQCGDNGTGADGDPQCGGGGKCTPRTCSDNHSDFCHTDADCATGKCRPTPASALLEYQGSDELYLDKMLIQPGCVGSVPAVKYIGKGTGSSYFNNRILNSFMYLSDSCAVTTAGLQLSREGSCGGSNCPSTSPEVMVQNLQIDGDIYPFDIMVDVDTSTKLIVKDMAYDACRRSVDGIISYVDTTNNRWAGGENDLGELNCSEPDNPQNGETWTNSGFNYIRRAGVTYQALDAILTSPATGDTYYRNSSGQIVNRGIGSSGTVYTVSGGVPDWVTHNSTGDPHAQYQLKLGDTGPRTLVLSTNSTGALTLAGSTNSGTIYGGSASSQNLILKSTSANDTTGKIQFGTLGEFDVLNNRWELGSQSCSVSGTELCVVGDGDVSGGLTVQTPGNTDTNAVVTRTATQTLTNKSIGATQLTGTVDNARLDSTAPAFLRDGGTTSLTCGASNQGKGQVLDSGIVEYCDGASTSVARRLPIILLTTSTSATVSNTTTEGTLLGTIQGTTTIPTAWLNRVGATIRITVGGFHTTHTTGTNNITLKVKLGSTVILSRGPGTLTNSAPAGAYFGAEVNTTVRSTGASGTMYGSGFLKFDPGVFQLGPYEWAMNTTAQPVTVDLTADRVLDVTATWSAAETLNSVTGAIATVELLN